MHRDLEAIRLLTVLSSFRAVFSTSCFDRFVLLSLGWMLCPHIHSITDALVVTGVAANCHHAAFHNLFARATWSTDHLGYCLFNALEPLLPPQDMPLQAVVDDSLAQKKGPEVFGIGRHIDPVRSSRAFKVMAFGHVWVVLALIVTLPCTTRPFALPVLMRLYRNEANCRRTGHPFKKKTQLAREMIETLLRWAPRRRFEVMLDEGYANRTVVRGLPDNVAVIAALRSNVALYAPLPAGGRRKYGDRQPSAAQRLVDGATAWQTHELALGVAGQQSVRLVSWVALVRSLRGWQRCRVVLVDTRGTGQRTFRLFVCTNEEMPAVDVLLRYALRWSIEVAFYEMKQYLGFEASSARSELAVQRMVPFVGALYGAVVLWYAQYGHGSRYDVCAVRPWYRTRRGPSFADMLGAAQRAACCCGAFDPLSNTHPLLNLAPLLEVDAPVRRHPAQLLLFPPPSPSQPHESTVCAA